MNTEPTFKMRRNVIFENISITILFLIIGYISLIPYQYLSDPQVSILNFYFCPFKYLPVVLIFFLLFISILNPNSKIVINKYKYLNFLVACYLTIGFLSSFSAVNITLSITRFFYYVLTGVIILYFCIINVKNKFNVKLFIRFVIILGLLVSIYGVIEFIFKKNILYSEILNNSNYLYNKLVRGNIPLSRENRVVSTIGHPVTMGFFLIAPIVFSFMEFSLTKIIWKKLLLLICSLLLIIGLFLTFSRGSWIAILVIFFIYFWKKRKNILAFLIPVICMFFIIFSFSNTIRTTLISRNPESYLKNPTTTNRIMSYLTVSKIFSDYPLLGVGNANFRLIRGDYDEFTMSIEAPDNMFLMSIAERGIWGLSILIVILFYILNRLRKAMHVVRDEMSKEYLRAFFCIFIGFIVNMLTFDVLYQPVPRIIFWFLAGLAVTITNK